MSHKFTVEEVAEALQESGGIMTDTARILKCSRMTVHRYVHEYYPEELEPLLKSAEALLIDEARECIRKAINEGDWRAAKYLLNSRAGWAQTTHVDVTSNGNDVNGVIVLPSNGREGDDE